MQTIPFYIVDVFADAPFKGNQLAVFQQAQHLTTEQMLQIAQEIGFAESTFLMADQPTEQGFPVRIFTVEYEVPFAGHPTLGTAFVLQQFILKQEVPQLSLHVAVGEIPVEIMYQGNRPHFLSMRQINPTFGPPLPTQEFAEALGLPEAAFNFQFPIQEVSTGLPFLIIPLKTLADIQNVCIDPKPMQAYLEKHELYKTQRPDGLTVALYFFCPQTYHPTHQINARMLALENGHIIEDAATGSANGCLLGYLLHHDYYPNEELNLLVEQGYEIKRNATIKLQGKKHAPGQYEINVGGQVQLIAKGEWFVS
ncbi:PhzF family phenazine biosynthesis protein [Rufibacter sp. LB8]|uniref:PhzF family phenazine biosynthesis protein n=1 Tax=Rufibacter sp. LB8 TaxID=2777781 RepID=UPI00178C3D31|nr:PhzF family phenazine biosynthesis protein [Rufibacter sp. LB8]